jgi:5-methyltetrahydropteroyltriglutamate--homocysteine methyltransferase
MNSNGRILTTHVGSLPRPDDLVEIMFAREDGIPIDEAALAARVERAVGEAVEHQVRSGVDIVNDGEWPKPSYATYIKDRLHGFGGTGTSYVFQDLEDYPRSKLRMAGDPGRKHRKTPACNAPISVKDMEAPRVDAARLTAAARQHSAVGTFMSAASPGVVGLFFRNDHYPDHERYIFALAEAMRHEYETIVAAGHMLQVDCPDLAMGRHTQYRELSLAEFRGRMELHIEALNRALVNIPAGKVRMHLCWGNYPGRTTATCRSRTSWT